MERWTTNLTISAYTNGIEAGYRTGKYEGAKQDPSCPYHYECDESMAWWDGFVDATEDLIEFLMSD